MRFTPLLILGGCLIALLLKPVLIGVENHCARATLNPTLAPFNATSRVMAMKPTLIQT